MRKVFISLLVMITLGSCSIAQDKTIVYDDDAQVRNLPAFKSINISGAFDLYISQDDRQVVAVSGNGISTSVENGELRISAEKKVWNAKGKIYVSVPVLERIQASGASNIKVKGILSARKFIIDFSGATDFSGAINADLLNVHLSGSSDVNLQGHVNQLESQLSGACDLNAYSCAIDYLVVNASGATKVEATVHKEIKAFMSGASDLHYKGRAVIREQSLSGAASLKSMN